MTETLHAYRVNVISLGTATIYATTKAAAERRARRHDYDVYELREPEPAITSLAQGKPRATGVAPVKRRVVYRGGAKP